MRQIAVIGLGRFGESVGRALRELGQEVLGIDTDETRTQALADVLTHVVQADATQEGVLAELGVGRFDAAVVAMGADIEASTLVTLTLKELGAKHVVARASSVTHGKVLAKVGADRVVFPESDMGQRVAYGLLHPNVVDYFRLVPDYSVIEMTAPRSFHGLTLSQLDLRRRFGANIILIRRQNDVNASPGGDDTIEPGDLLVVSGTTAGLEKLGGVE